MSCAYSFTLPSGEADLQQDSATLLEQPQLLEPLDTPTVPTETEPPVAPVQELPVTVTHDDPAKDTEDALEPEPALPQSPIETVTVPLPVRASPAPEIAGDVKATNEDTEIETEVYVAKDIVVEADIGDTTNMEDPVVDDDQHEQADHEETFAPLDEDSANLDAAVELAGE